MTCDPDVRMAGSLCKVIELLTLMTAESMERAEATLDTALESAAQLRADGRLTDEAWQRELSLCREMVCTANAHWERRLLKFPSPPDAGTASRSWTA